MTHLSGNFFWLQFRSGPPYRYLTLALIVLMFFVGGPLLKPWTSALSTFVTVPVIFFFLFPEVGALQALGMNRARASRLVGAALVPAVLIPAALSLTFNPNWIGLAGTAVALAVGVVVYFVALPNDSFAEDGNHSKTASAATSAAATGTPTPFTLFWRPNLLAALAAGAVTGLVMPLATLVEHDFLRALISTIPALIFWVRVAGGSELRAATWQSLGLPRKRWLTTALGVILAASALFGAAAIIASALITSLTQLASAPVSAFLFAAALGVAAMLLALAGTVSWDGLTFVGIMMFSVPLRYPMDPLAPLAIGEMLILGPALGGFAVFIAALLVGRYVAGR